MLPWEVSGEVLWLSCHGELLTIKEVFVPLSSYPSPNSSDSWPIKCFNIWKNMVGVHYTHLEVCVLSNWKICILHEQRQAAIPLWTTHLLRQMSKRNTINSVWYLFISSKILWAQTASSGTQSPTESTGTR